MADNVQITAGAGTTISTDDAGANGHIQRMKLCYGADGDATQVGADVNGLDVDVTRLPALPAGGNVIGEVGVTELPAAAALAEGAANPTTAIVGSGGLLFNGTTWDRLHGNWRTTTGDTGAKTTTGNGATQTNFDSVGAFITVRLGIVSGTSPAMTLQLQWSPDAGTTWFNLGPTAANLTASNQNATFLIGPTNWSSAAAPATPAVLINGSTQNVFINAFLPRTWRMAWTIGGTTPSLTITAIDVNYIGGA